MTLNEFLVWLGTAGGASGVVSWILEQVPAFQALDSKVKWWVMLGSSVALSLASWAILTYVPAETLQALMEPFKIVFGVVIAFLANQVMHKIDPNKQ